jgi:hypothetical protein
MVDDMIEALALKLHDTYGCRITCRGGRLADDRHPSHMEAYRVPATGILLDPAIREALTAALEEAISAAHPDGRADHPGPGCATAIVAHLLPEDKR